MTDVPEAGQAVVEALYQAFNSAEPQRVHACLHFPLVILAGEAPVILATPEEFGPDFEALRRSERWARTTLDRIEVVGSSPGRVYCLVALGRYDVDGRRYLSGTALYTVTKVAGRWGVQSIVNEMWSEP
jgi:hypothetical protein